MIKQTTRVRFTIFYFLVIVFLFALISARLFYIANSKVVDGTNMKVFAQNRNMKNEILVANRGTIFDASGEALAHNVTAYTVIAFLDETRTTNQTNPKHVVDKELTARTLSPIINMSEKTILNLLNRNVKQVELGPGGRDISELTKQKIEKLDLPGISFIKGLKREYPYGQFASYILGYTKKNDDGVINGEMGIEMYYNDQLKGEDGYKIYQKDIYGYQIPDTPYQEKPASSGKDIYLTIDSNIQIFLENAMNNIANNYTLDWGILTVMDAETGAVVGSATYPSFDLRTKNIVNYNNPLTSYTFEPGSTMKIFNFMAAMENNLYNGEEKYKSGSIDIKGTKISDANDKGWGTISYNTGFTYSSNTAASYLALKMGKEKLENYYKLLGFNKITGIELANELSGKIDIRYDIEIANASFGQGITITPIQILQAMTPITNNGILLKPYIIDKIVDPKTKKVVYQGARQEIGKVASQDTINQITELLYLAVNNDDQFVPGKKYQTDLVTLIGKTGTAQIVDKTGKYATGPYDYVRSFVGIFPKENPEYIVYIATNKLQGSSSVLSTTINEVVENISKNKYLGNEKIENNSDNIYEMPNLLNMKIENAKNNIATKTKEYIILGNGTHVIKQYPLSNTKNYKDNKVFLLTNDSKVMMPNIINWSENEVRAFCSIIKANCKINNYGFVTSSSIPKDELIDLSKELIIDLKPKSDIIE